MTLQIIGIVVLAVVVFAFVLEPVLRARGDRVVLDSVALPRPVDLPEDDEIEADATDSGDAAPERTSGGRVTLDRPVSSDIS